MIKDTVKQVNELFVSIYSLTATLHDCGGPRPRITCKQAHYYIYLGQLRSFSWHKSTDDTAKSFTYIAQNYQSTYQDEQW